MNPILLNITEKTFTLTEVSEFFVCLVAIVSGISLIYKYLKKFAIKLVKDEMETTVKEGTLTLTKSIEDMNNSLLELKETLDNYIKENNADMVDIKKALCDEIREKIHRIHKECVKADYVSDHTMEIIEELWDDYNNRLNGNHFVGDLVDSIREIHRRCHIDGQPDRDIV